MKTAASRGRRVVRRRAVRALLASGRVGPVGALLRTAVGIGSGILHARRAVSATRQQGPRLAGQRAVGRVRRLAPWHGSRLVVVQCRVSGQLDVSLVVSGPPHRLAEVIGLELRSAAGSLHPTQAVMDLVGDRLRVSTTLPEEAFNGGSSHELVLETASGIRRLAVIDPTVVRHRLSAAAFRRRGWPVRVTLSGGHPHVSGTVPTHRSLDHTVEVTLTAAAVTWKGAGRPVESLRLTCRQDLRTVSVAAVTDEDGRWRATLDPEELVHPSSDWDVEVVRGADAAPLLCQLGEYPRLGRVVTFPELRVATDSSGLARVHLYYTGGNALAVRVRPVRALVR
jgi:hypothetical protein